MDTVRTIVQELDTSDAKKKELQENVFVIKLDAGMEYFLFFIILEAWQLSEVSLQAVNRREQVQLWLALCNTWAE
jgi:hypothetical protein